MDARLDPSLLRRRRAVEASAVVARGSGLISTALFVAGRLGVPTGDIPPGLRLVCLIGIAVMAGATTLAGYNLRRPAGPRYGLLSALQVAGDLLVMCGIVVWFEIDGGQTTWPGLVVPIVVAALRHRLPGALIAWAVTSAGFATVIIALGDRAVRPEDLPFAIAIHLVVAVISGTQSGAFARQVAELDATRRALHHQATHDSLTGLPNRAHLSEYADGLPGRALAVLLLDLNGFKQVNDTLGHAVGDLLLREVGRRLSTDLRSGDVAGRLGGDEFLILLPDADPATVTELTARLRVEISRPVDLDGVTVTVGVSIGSACRPPGAATELTRLTAEADAAMYRDKVPPAAARIKCVRRLPAGPVPGTGART
ncbi:diguanylate cyclase domain-containing protein [Micromonosporaceae bacterium Da 78-11]